METLNRVKITKATDQETLVENQKMLSESANKNASEDDKNGTENTSHNDASLVLGKHVSPSLETLKSDQISATVTCLRETSLPTVKLNDLNSESYHLEVAAAEQAVKGSDGVKKLKSAGLESLGLEPKLLCESSERIVPETTTKKKSTFLTDNNDRITVNEQQTKAQCEGAPLMSSVASEKGKEVLGNGDNVRDFKAGDALMNVKVTESKAQDSRPTTISDSHTRSIDCSTDENVKQNSAVDFTDQIQNQMSGVIQKQTSKDSEEELLNSPEKFQHGLENAKGNETHSTGAEIKLPQSCAEKDDRAKTIACHTFNKSCKIKSNSNHEKALMPNTPDQIQNKTANIEVAKQIEVTKKNISNSDKASGIVGEITRNENETINKQKSPGNIKSYPNPEILKVECSTLKRLQQEHDFQKISPALPDSFNTSPTLPSISTSSPTPSNFSGIFSKKSSHLSNAEEDFHKLKKKSLHFSTRPREFIIPAASVLCNVDNLENATKLNKKLHWELLDNRNELTEIEDDTDIEMTDEERHKLKGEIKQEQVSPRESPQQSPKNVQDEQSNPQEINCGTQTMPPKIHKSKQYKYKLSKTIKSNPKSMKVNKLDSVIHSSVIEQKPFTIVLPKRQRGRPRKLENLLKATIKAKTGPRILKKRGRKPKKRIEFTESFDNNSMECAEPSNDKIADAVISDGECASNVKQNDELLLEETPTEIRRTCGTILHQEEDKSRQSSSELNDKNNQQRSSEDNYTRNPECFTKNQVISMEPETKVVEASTNKDCDDAGKSRQITARADQNSNPESKKISKESYTEMSVNKPVTLSLNSGNNCDDVSTTSGDSENKLLIISDGGQEELNEKQTEKELSSTKSKPPERRKSASTKKDKKYISLEDIGIKVRPFKGHLSTLRIPKVNKDADQTNAWKLETYEEFDKQQLEEKVEQKIESEMNGSTKTVKVANKDFLSTYRIPKIKRDTGLGKDNLETSDNTPKGEKHEKIKESYPFESKDKLNNNCNATEAKSLDKTKHTWRPDNAGLKEKSEKSYKTPRQQKDDECGNAGSKTETSKRKLFNLETYNDDVDHEDKLGNVEVNKQIKACAEKKLSDSKLSEKESPCCTAKPVKLRRKSLNMPRKMLLTSSDEEEAKHLENVDAKNPLERNALYTRKKASLHRRILDSSCDEEVEVLDSKIKEKSTNKPNIPLKQRRKSMFVESTTDFHHSDERLSDKRLTSKDLVKSTSCSETFDSENNADMLSSSENIKFLKTTVETTDSKDTGPKKSLKIRRKSLFVESTCSKTPSLDDTKTTDVMQNDNTAHVKPRKDDDNIVGSSIKNKNDNTELKRTRLSKPRRKSMYVETDFASDLKDNFEGVNKTKEMLTNPMEKILKMGRTSTDVKTTSVNETSKKEISTDEPVDRKDDVEMERKSTIRDLTEERNNSHEPIDKEIDVEPILKQNNKEDPVNTNEITNDLDSCPLKPRRKSINHRRILDSSSDDNEPLMKKPLLIVNEIKPPAAPTEPKTKVRKRRIVKVLSTSRDSINTSANSSLQSENLTQIHSNSPSPFASPLHNHPIFNREVSIQSREFVASMPVTPNQQDDDKKFKEIDSKLHQIFQSPQYATEYKTNHNTTADSNIMEMLSTSLPTGNQGKSITSETALDHNQENDQSSANVVINKPGPSPHTTTVDSNKLDMLSASLTDSQGMDVIPREAQPDINQENNQSSTNITQINESNATLNNTTAASPNCSEIKHLSLGSAEYRFEKVSENVVNLFISRKRKRKRHN
ncbi:hypothetical protein DOY81_001281 [Sarcophaga bullata]|nr:hypothetical protein DOY81_001281 [Sarcophaga bullata]